MKQLKHTMLAWLLLTLSNSHANEFAGQIHNHISLETIQAQQAAFETGLDRLQLWEATVDLPIGDDADLLSRSLCEEKMEDIDNLAETYFFALHLQKLAIDCHNLLAQSEHAAQHESHVLNLAKLITASGNGENLKSAFWITDIHSAYEFIEMAGYEVIDAELRLHKGKTYLAVLAKTDDIFGEYRFFQLNQYFKSINQTVSQELTEEETKYFNTINLVLKTDLQNNEGLFVLAHAGVTEAQILLAKLLLRKTTLFPTLYKDAFYLLEQAAANNSIIAKYNLAYRIFIDKMEDRYSQGHDLIADALSARYIPALSLAAIVREQKLGIKRDKKTIAEIISLLETQGEPGDYELLIGQSMLNDRVWNNHKLAKKYLEASIEKNNPHAMYLMGLMHEKGYAVKKSAKKAMEWYRKASQSDTSGDAFYQIGLALVMDPDDEDKANISQAIQYFIRSAELGKSKAYGAVGHLYYYQEFKHVDYQKAHQYFTLGHENGDTSSTLNLAQMLYHGHGVPADHSRAFQLFESIQDEGMYDTEIYLAAAYHNGFGTQKNMDKAMAMYSNIISKSHAYQNNRLNLILANLNQRMGFMGMDNAVTPSDGLIEKLQKQAAANDHVAMFKLGFLGYLKYAPNKIEGQGIDWLKKAAQSGVPYAHTLLANFYRWEKKDDNRKHHNEQALKLRDAEAIYYSASDMLNENPSEAIELLKESAAMRQLASINLLAKLYEEGENVTVDYIQALKYYRRAYSLGDHDALSKIMDLYVNEKINTAQFGDTIELIKKVAEKNKDYNLMRQIAKFYSLEHMPEHDPTHTIDWYIRAYEAGNTEAIIELGKHYMYGIGIDQDFDLAQFFFANSTNKPVKSWTDLNAEPGSFWVALLLQKGLGLEQDLNLARKLYKNNFFSPRSKEAKNNYAVMTCQLANPDKREAKEAFKLIKANSDQSRTSLFNLGWMYEHGLCTKQKTKAALEAYEKAAEKNSPHALYRLYLMYRDGDHVTADIEKAKDYLRRSVEVSKKVLYHNMMSTFIDLPYIKQLKLVEPEI